MTFTELVNEVMARTRQTSDEARTRIGREINDRYRRVGTSVGLENARLLQYDTLATPGDERITFGSHIKPITVWIGDPSSFRRILYQITLDEYRQRTIAAVPMQGPPTMYAIGEYTANGSPYVYLYPIPDAGYWIHADVITHAVDLVGTDTPSFPSDFHDVLMYGALADEWQQLKQDELEARATALYEQRLAELRYFIAKSNTLAIVQGGRGGFTRGDYLPGYLVPPPGWYR